ncbi:MAG: hypothetical protein IPH35_18960 [Rhodoferax sp.]|nr:hypothetical protein [Rhodoferax sp.]
MRKRTTTTSASATQAAPDLETVLKTLCRQAEEDNNELDSLSNIIKLAARESEMRRVLTVHGDLLPYFPDAQKCISESVKTGNTWGGMPDVSGMVLWEVADRLDKLGNQIVDRPYAAKSALGAMGDSSHE